LAEGAQRQKFLIVIQWQLKLKAVALGYISFFR